MGDHHHHQKWCGITVCLTFTNSIRHRGARTQYFLLITGAAGDARLPGVFLVRVRVLVALFAHRVVIKVAAVQHALAFGTFGAGLTPLCHCVHIVFVVANAGGVVGVGAWRFHAKQASAYCAGLTFLCVTKVF